MAKLTVTEALGAILTEFGNVNRKVGSRKGVQREEWECDVARRTVTGGLVTSLRNSKLTPWRCLFSEVEVDSLSADEGIIHSLWDPMIHYRLHKSQLT
jgi:hypothetical protein